jgi:hypothetical protein
MVIVSSPTMQNQRVSSIFDQSGALNSVTTSVSTVDNEEQQNSVCELPGDPSLILTTNVDLGTAKIDIMKCRSTGLFRIHISFS